MKRVYLKNGRVRTTKILAQDARKNFKKNKELHESQNPGYTIVLASRPGEPEYYREVKSNNNKFA